jgi:outer membrane protein assembly factor BamB
MDRKIVLVVILVVMSATAFPVAGLLPIKVGFAEQTKQIELGNTGRSGSNDVWPMFRHDAGNTGYSQFFAPNTNHLAWKHQIGSDIYQSTPILYADKLYISTNWNFGGPLKMTKIFDTPPSSPSEILQSLLGRQNDVSAGLYCLDAKTGEQLWFRPMDAPTDPAIVDDKMYVTDMNYDSYYSSLYCLDAATGDIIWQKSINSLIFSPTIVANEKIFLGCFDLNSYFGSVKCYDLSGNLLWNHPLQGNEALWFSAPAVSGGNVYFITSDMYSYFTGKLYCLNAATGQLLWSHPVFSFGWYSFYATPSAVCADMKVFVVDYNMNTYEGFLICYDGATGNTEWTCYLGQVLSFASPTVCADSVYITAASLSSYDNWLYRIDSKNGTYLWRVSLPYSSYFGFGSPICSADKILVSPGMYGGYSNELYCFEREDGMQDWKFMVDSYILGGPSIGDGRAYVADNAGNIYAFEDVLKIQDVLGGIIGVNAIIQNTGNTTLTNISWNISVVGGSLGMINRTRFSTIQELQAGRSKIIRLIPVIGLGRVEIIVKVTMPNMSTIKKVKQGLIFGSVCLVLP